MANCLMCKRELDVPGVPESVDCGGDCQLCLAECGDDDCRLALGMKPWSDEDE